MKKGTTAEHVVVFLLGFIAYGLCELIWRGYTHWTMPPLGGVCFLCLYIGEKKFKSLPLYIRACCAGVFITSLELMAGSVINIALRMGVWDYSELPFNLYGQVCLSFLFMWVFLSGVSFFICDFIAARFSTFSTLAK